MLINKLPEVIQKHFKALFEYTAFLRFTTVEGNAFRTFAQTNHTETEIRFIFLLDEVDFYQLAANKMGNIGANHRIKQ